MDPVSPGCSARGLTTTVAADVAETTQGSWAMISSAIVGRATPQTFNIDTDTTNGHIQKDPSRLFQGPSFFGTLQPFVTQG